MHGASLTTPAADTVAAATRVTMHIGFPKTASTTLQTYLTERRTSIEAVLMEDDASRQDPRKFEIIRAIQNPDDTVFDRQLPSIIAGIDAARAAGRHFAFSDEGFAIGSALSRRAFACVDRERLAHRLHRIAPDAHIVAVVREQRDLVASLYADMRYRGSVREELPKWLDRQLAQPYPESILAHFRYADVADLYNHIFGDEQVHVLLFEDLKRHDDLFAARFASIAGLDTDDLLTYLRTRTVNAAGRRPKLVLTPGTLVSLRRRLAAADWRGLAEAVTTRARRLVQPDIKPHIDAVSLERIADYFADSNRRLAHITGIDLAAYGYSC